MTARLLVSRVAGSEDLPLPSYATEGAAGLDLRAAVREPLTLAPGERALVPTGLRIALPAGFEGPRVFAIVKVDGHRVFAVVRDSDPAAITLGQRVRLAPLRVADDSQGNPRYLPAFRPA